VTCRRTLFVAGALLLAGCSHGKEGKPTTRPAAADDPADKAMRDPFGYSPSWGEAEEIGSDTYKLDRKGIKRDLGHVIMP